MALLYVDNDTDALGYEQIVQLDGLQYVLSFVWSSRETAWYLDISAQDGTPICSGIRLVVEFPLLRRFISNVRPPGEFICYDLTGNARDITLSTDLGGRVKLVYITSDDALLTGGA